MAEEHGNADSGSDKLVIRPMQLDKMVDRPLDSMDHSPGGQCGAEPAPAPKPPSHYMPTNVAPKPPPSKPDPPDSAKK